MSVSETLQRHRGWGSSFCSVVMPRISRLRAIDFSSKLLKFNCKVVEMEVKVSIIFVFFYAIVNFDMSDILPPNIYWKVRRKCEKVEEVEVKNKIHILAKKIEEVNTILRFECYKYNNRWRVLSGAQTLKTIEKQFTCRFLSMTGQKKTKKLSTSRLWHLKDLLKRHFPPELLKN